MKTLIQRVLNAKVVVDNKTVGQIEKGLLIFLGVTENDTLENIDYLVNKIINLRIFNDKAGKMNLSLLDVAGEALVVSQFTLYADCQRGRRPSYTNAASPQFADEMYQIFLEKIMEAGVKTASGVFGAHMQVSILNDGPVTIMLEK